MLRVAAPGASPKMAGNPTFFEGPESRAGELMSPQAAIFWCVLNEDRASTSWRLSPPPVTPAKIRKSSAFYR